MATAEVAAAAKTIKIGAGWRTTWVDNMTLGSGFHREISTVAPSAVVFKPLASEPELVAQQIHGYFKLVSSSSDFTEVLTAGGGVSMEGWGASGSATMAATSNMRLSTDTLTALVSMRYLSDPVLAVNPSNLEQEVMLSDPAKAVLENEGPEAFHEIYGSHYIAGYCKGGWLIGTYDMQYNSAEDAKAASGSIKAAFKSGAVFKAKAHAEFSSAHEDTKNRKGTFGQYTCSGWSSDHPPQLTCELKDLMEAHNKFNTASGVKVEAVIRSYRDIPQYGTSRAIWFASEKYALQLKTGPAQTIKTDGPKDPYDEVFIEPHSYGIIVHTLNVEYARLAYLYQYYKDDPQETLVQISDEARATMRQFKRLLTLKAGSGTTGLGEIRKTLKALESFLVVWDGDEPAEADADRGLWEQGRDWLNAQFRADDLEARAGTLQPVRKNGPPVRDFFEWSLGNDWRITTQDGNLRFYLGEKQVFALGSDLKLWSEETKEFSKLVSKESGEYSNLVKNGDPITLRSAKDGRRLRNNDDYTPRDHKPLHRPAAFDNGSRGDWEKMFVEKF